MNARSKPTPSRPEAGRDGERLQVMLQAVEQAEDALMAAYASAAGDALLAVLDDAGRAASHAELQQRLLEVGAAVFAAWKTGGADAFAELGEAMDSSASSASSNDDSESAGETRSRFQTIVTHTEDAAAARPALTARDLVARQARRISRPVSSGGRGARGVLDAGRVLADWFAVLGDAPGGLAEAEAARDIERLHDLLDSALDAWAELPPVYNHLLTSYLTKRVRAAQRVVDGVAAHTEELATAERLIRALSRHSKQSRPGFVHGLALSHGPEHGSWLDDARVEAERIRAALPDNAAPGDED